MRAEARATASRLALLSAAPVLLAALVLPKCPLCLGAWIALLAAAATRDPLLIASGGALCALALGVGLRRRSRARACCHAPRATISRSPTS